MTFVALQYPAVIAAFFLCALLAVLTAASRRCSTVFFLLSGLLAVAGVILALVFSVPFTEILLMLVIPALLICLCSRKEAGK